MDELLLAQESEKKGISKEYQVTLKKQIVFR